MGVYAVKELSPERDNFHDSIYDGEPNDHDGLLIARCNQNGTYPEQTKKIVSAWDRKSEAVAIIECQNARIEALEQALRDIDQILCEEWHRHQEKMIAAILERAIARAALAQTGESNG